jgi:CRISPR-associated protein Cmr2
MPDLLFIFSLGPVQSFIAQARKTQDLYTGSFILSELSRKAGHILELNNGKLIYPQIKNRSIPNLLVGRLKNTTLSDATKIMVDIVQKLVDQLIEWVNIATNEGLNSDLVYQVKQLLESYWVVYPVKQSYPNAYRELTSLLGSIKTLRRFGQAKERGLKCSVCGSRNAIFFVGNQIPKNMKLDTHPIAVIDDSPAIIKKNERLCTLCFMKRKGKEFLESNYDSEFPSVAKVALMNVLEYLEKQHQDLYNSYRKCFGRHFDWELLYETSLTKKYLEKNGYDVVSFEDVKKLQKQIVTHLHNDGKILSNYYALILFDGDDMGSWVSGEHLADIEHLEEFQSKLTYHLGEYADSLDNIVKYPHGKLIYSGGDDIAAFVNLQHIFPVLSGIRKRFLEKIVMSDIAEIKNDRIMTLSGGVCIAHRMTPLSSVLKWAKNMESESKKNPGKNSFTLGIMRRGGEIRYTIQKWDYNLNGKEVNTLSDIQTILHTLHEGLFSQSYLWYLINELESLRPIKKDPKENNMIRSEIQRLVSRSYSLEKKESETDQEYEETRLLNIHSVTSALMNLYSSSETSNFISLLDICLFLSKEGA